MTQQIPLARASIVGTDGPHATHRVAADIAYQRLAIVNVAFVGLPGSSDWVLVDAGLPGTRGEIRKAAEAMFGAGARPRAIVLTHGHFDHVGVLEDLAREWDVPVHAHRLEAPYLDGRAAYPPPDPGVGGGLLALSSPLFPRSPINLGERLSILPDDGTVPPLPGWRAIHTPGHSVGHVSLWRESDRTLLAGDAFVTTAQESVYSAATQSLEMHGPPMYFTHDWEAAARSVRELAALKPEIAVTGHGRAVGGPLLREALDVLALRFESVAVPATGRYLHDPQRPADGSAYRTP